VQSLPISAAVGVKPAQLLTRSVARVLDRLARSLPDARAIADELTVREVRLNLAGSV
jgi:hypothetical protein